jgi:hypothetical protein
MKLWNRFVIAVPIVLAASIIVLAIYGNAVTKITPLPDPPTPNPNAFDEFALAYGKFHDLDIVKKYVDNGDTDPPPVPYPADNLGVPGSAHIIAENQNGLAMLKRSIGDDYCAPPQHTFAARYPYLGYDRAMARVLALDARRRESVGDWSGSMDGSLDILQMGNLVSSHGTLIPKLVSVALGGIGRHSAWKDSERLTRNVAMSAEQRMETITSQREPIAVTLKYEQDINDTSLVDAFSSREPLNDMFGTERTVLGLLKNLWYFTLRPKSRTLSLYNKYMSTSEAMSKLPFSQEKTLSDPPVPDDPFASILCPVPSKLVFKDTQDLTFDRLLTTSLALRAYSLDHKGAYPQTLAELTPAYMSQVPVDLFGSANASLVYRKREGAYLLYSVGPDGHDDGGRPCIGRLSDGKTSLRTYKETDTGDVVAGINNG